MRGTNGIYVLDLLPGSTCLLCLCVEPRFTTHSSSTILSDWGIEDFKESHFNKLHSDHRLKLTSFPVCLYLKSSAKPVNTVKDQLLGVTLASLSLRSDNYNGREFVFEITWHYVNEKERQRFLLWVIEWFGINIQCVRQGDINCSCLPAELGGNGEFERKFEAILGNLRKFVEFEMKFERK